MGLEGLLRRGLAVLALTMASIIPLKAEQRTVIPGSNAPEALCAVCAEADRTISKNCIKRTDLNYCSCRSSSNPIWRVLVRTNRRAQWTSFDSYLSSQVKNLQIRLRRRRARQGVIRRSVEDFKRTAQTKYRQYLSSCQVLTSGGPGGTPGGGDGGGGESDLVFEREGYSVSLLSYRGKRHTYAVSISKDGKVLGGAFQQEVQPRDPMQPHTFRAQEVGKQQITPLVWTAKGIKRACDNCPLGLQPHDLNSQGQAVGVRMSVDVSRPSGFIFNYATESLLDVPETTGKASALAAINDAGLKVGYIQRELTKGVPPYPLYDAAVWVDGGLGGGGSVNVISREAIINAHDKELAVYMLEQVKAQLKEGQENNGCSDAEIAQTVLVGKPTYADVTSVHGIAINSIGDILGTIISDSVRWNYANTCTSGVGMLPLLHSSFVRKVDGTIFVSPVAISALPTRRAGIPIGMMSNLTAVGLSVDSEKSSEHAFVQLSGPGASWRMVVYPGMEQLLEVVPMGLNDRGDIVGSYLVSKTDKSGRAYAILGGVFTDLTSLLGNQSEWRIETASDINDCGQIVGRAVNIKTGDNRAMLISPQGCSRG